LIAIIDYGMGNLASVKNAFLKLGYKTFISSKPDDILSADRVVLPGVGAFGDAINSLQDTGLDRTIYRIVKESKPLLGVCLGLQLLFTESEENGVHKGLDIIQGRVIKFKLPSFYKVPHMGWNEVKPDPGSQLFKNILPGSYFYFVHSYYVVPEDNSFAAAVSDYGLDFICAVEKDNLFATQFHPEKSGSIGLEVLKNFAEI